MVQPEIRFNGFNDEWVEKKLGESEIRVTTGKLNANAATVNGKYPFFTTALETYMTDSYSFDDDAILVAGNGNLGFVKEYSGKFDAYQREYVLTNFEGYVKSYLVSYFKHSLSDHISHSSKGSAMPYITKDVLESFLIVSPSLPEQQKIGALFSKYDTIIALREQKLEELNALKKGLLQQMFDDGLKPQVRFSGFNDEWVEKKLGDVAEIIMGQSPHSINYTDNPQDHILVQGNADMKNGRVVPRVWTKEVTKMVDANYLILGVRAPVGVVGKTDYPVVLGRGVAAIKGNDFLYQFLQRLQEIGYWNRMSTGSTFDSINSQDVKGAKIQLPSLPEQQKIGQLFKHLDARISNEQTKIEQLKAQKSGLLQRML